MTTKEEVLEKDLNALDCKHILKNKCSIIIMSYNLHDSFSFVCGRSNYNKLHPCYIKMSQTCTHTNSVKLRIQGNH